MVVFVVAIAVASDAVVSGTVVAVVAAAAALAPLVVKSYKTF